MVKLIDLRSETTDDVEFGTCELCMYTGTLNEEWFVFEDDKGNTCEIATGRWCWGDYEVHYAVRNLGDFCQFILDKQIPDLKTLGENFDEIYEEYDYKVYKEMYPEEDYGSYEL